MISFAFAFAVIGLCSAWLIGYGYNFDPGRIYQVMFKGDETLYM